MTRPISNRNAEHYRWGECCDGWHLVRNGTLSVIQEKVPPGAGEVRHLHRNAEQFFYVLSGVATLEVEGQVIVAAASEGVHVPAGCAHRLENRGDTDLEFLVISTPPSHGDREPA